MNVKEALERLKAARAYINPYKLHFTRQYPGPTPSVPHIRPHRYGVVCAACNELDKSYRDAVDALAEHVNLYCDDDTRNREHARKVFAELKAKLFAANTALEEERRRGQISAEFRMNSDLRRWETSYTKKIVDGLRKAFPATFDAEEPAQWPKGDWIRKASELLTDYHTTLHVPYRQRDEAQATAEQRAKDIETLESANTELAAERDQLKRWTSAFPFQHSSDPAARSLKAAVTMADIETFVRQSKPGDTVESHLVARVFDALAEAMKHRQRDCEMRDAASKKAADVSNRIGVVRHRVLGLKNALTARIGRDAVRKLITDAKVQHPAIVAGVGFAPRVPDSTVSNTHVDQLGVIERALWHKLESLKAPIKLENVRLSFNSLAPSISSKLIANLAHDLANIMDESEVEHPRAAAYTISHLIDAKIAESKT